MGSHPGIDELVGVLLSSGAITTSAVEAAFRAVPRHLFVPEVSADRAYRNEAIPTKLVDGRAVSSASQPSIVAAMLEQLDVKQGQRVLEVGAGTGYNAALLAHLVGPSGHVVTGDIDEDIVGEARGHLAAAGVEGVEVISGDGGLGHPPEAPYDRIIVTVGAWDIVPAWWEQLAAGGRLVAPLSLRGVQRCIAFDKRDGWMESASVRDCGFMRLRGGFHGPETIVSAGSVTVTFDSKIDVTGLTEILSRPSAPRVLGVSTAPEQIFGGLALWLALHDPGYCTIDAAWPPDRAAPLPVATTIPSGDVTLGWSPGSFDGTSLAVVGHTDDELTVHTFGAPGHASRVAELIRQWDAGGRPSSQSLRLRAHPAPEPIGDAEELVAIHKRWTTLLIDWPSQLRAPTPPS